MNPAPVVIDDDDDDDDICMVEPIEIIDDEDNTGHKRTPATTDPATPTDTIATIVLDDETTPNTYSKNKTEKKNEKTFARLLKNNKLMDDLVQYCLNMENSAGLARVINKTVLPLYKDTHIKYKESKIFSRIMKTILHKLKHDPDHKFLHIKSFCDELKSGKFYRKVPFVTLATDLKKKHSRTKSTKEHKDKHKNTDTGNIIDVDSDNVVISVDGDDEDNDDIMIVNDAISTTGSEQSNKENTNVPDITENNAAPVENELLVPKKTVAFENYANTVSTSSIRMIENKIIFCKQMIAKLEEQEVNDEIVSPYLECDRYKTQIVHLYKELCRITGRGEDSLMKQRVVRLHVAEGLAPGPVKRLEEFLNKSVDNTGVVPLPDFHDVVKCVTEANYADSLGYTRQEVMKEAIALFTHCGHALRKRRQKREYRDLMSLVRDKSLEDYDPAKEDPELLAELEKNKLQAKLREDNLFERFVQMEHEALSSTLLRSSLRNTDKQNMSESSDSHSCSDLELTPENINENYSVTLEHNEADKGNCQTNTENACASREETLVNQENVACTPNPVPEQNCNSVPTQSCVNTDIDTSTQNVVNRINTQNIVDTSRDKSTQNVVNRHIDTLTQNVVNAHLETSTKTLVNTDFGTSTQTFVNALPLEINSLVQNITNQLRSCINIELQNCVNTMRLNCENTSTQNTMHTPTQHCINTLQTNNIIIPNTPDAGKANYTHQNIITNKLHKLGESNRYFITFESSKRTEENVSNVKNIETEPTDIGLQVPAHTLKTTQLGSSENGLPPPESENVPVKLETAVKKEPVDIQHLLSELGDNYIATVFDIEDPFLVIDISSDSSEDEL